MNLDGLRKFLKENVHFAVFVASFLSLLGISFRYLESLFVWGNGEFDDNLMYLILVKRFWECHFPTFDCINPTTGFHPLNFLVYAVLYKLSEIAGVKFYYVTTIVYSIVFLSSMFIVFRILNYLLSKENISGKNYALYLPFIFFANYFTLNTIIDGFDSILSLLFLSAFFYYYLKARSNASLKHYVVLGLIGSLMFLSRTDLIIFVAVFSLFEFILTRKLREFSYYLLGFLPLFLVYVFLNYYLTGSFFQGSLMAKLSLSSVYHEYFHARFKELPVQVYYIISIPLRIAFSNVTFDRILMSGLNMKLAIVLGMLADSILYLIILYSLVRHFDERREKLLLMIMITLISYVLFYSLLGLGVRPWYFPIYNFFLLMVGALLLPRVHFKKMPLLLFFIAIFLYAQNLYLTFLFSIESKSSVERVNKELGSFLESLKGCDYVFCFDKCGIIGFFFDSKGMVSINLDGKLNSKALPYIKSKRLEEYVCSMASQDDLICPVVFNPLLPKKLGINQFEFLNRTGIFEAIRIDCKR